MLRKFLIQIIGFFLLFFLTNYLYLATVKAFDWNFSKHLEAINLDLKNFDCLILGNSLPMDGIDAEYLSTQGLSTYNLSIGGASLQTSIEQLKQYLTQAHDKPKLVVMALGSCLEQDFQKTSINPIVSSTMKDRGLKWRDLPMLKFRWMAPELLKKIISKRHREAKTVAGQLKIKYVKPDFSKPSLRPIEQIDSSTYKNAILFSELNKLCRQASIKLIALEMPGVIKTRNNIPIGPHKISLNDHTTLKLYNFNNLHFCNFSDPQQDWLGDSHLNEKGARKFTKAIAEILKTEAFQNN